MYAHVREGEMNDYIEALDKKKSAEDGGEAEEIEAEAPEKYDYDKDKICLFDLQGHCKFGGRHKLWHLAVEADNEARREPWPPSSSPTVAGGRASDEAVEVDNKGGEKQLFITRGSRCHRRADANAVQGTWSSGSSGGRCARRARCRPAARLRRSCCSRPLHVDPGGSARRRRAV